MKLLLATNNKGKLRELRRILEPLGFELDVPMDLGMRDVPVEDAETFEGNALIKARYFAKRAGIPALADDSGLCVDALGGEPGVRSARFAGENATDRDNNAKLLNLMKDVEDGKRTAHFECAAACVMPDGRSLVAFGRTDGVILHEARGELGFGYDPLFFSPRLGKTFGEVDHGAKDAVSHRGMAFRALAEKLPSLIFEKN